MTIILRHNQTLELNRVEYTGAMNARELFDHAAFNAANPIWLGFDCISVIHADVEVSTISSSDLDRLFKTHRELFEPLGLLFIRRSGWVCESAAGQRFLSHWLAKRNEERSPWAELRQFATFEAVGDWLLLNSEETSKLKVGDGFTEIARFEAAPSIGR